MKKFRITPIFALSFLFLLSCQQGPSLAFQKEGCAVCHLTRTESIGPSLKTIAEVYRGLPDSRERLVRFLDRKEEPLVNALAFENMEINLIYSARWPREKKQLIADYILATVSE